jgi:hypothetical protein
VEPLVLRHHRYQLRFKLEVRLFLSITLRHSLRAHLHKLYTVSAVVQMGDPRFLINKPFDQGTNKAIDGLFPRGADQQFPSAIAPRFISLWVFISLNYILAVLDPLLYLAVILAIHSVLPDPILRPILSAFLYCLLLYYFPLNYFHISSYTEKYNSRALAFILQQIGG